MNGARFALSRLLFAVIFSAFFAPPVVAQVDQLKELTTKLRDAVKRENASQAKPEEKTTSPTLRKPSKPSRDEWRQVQKRLNELGYDAGVVDGLPGQQTKAAIEAFQRRNKLLVDGALGSKTLFALFGEDALSQPQSVTRTAKPSYDCGARLNPTERTICDSGVLAALDLKLNVAYKTARAANSTVKSTQRSWLKSRNSCGRNAQCIETRYRERIAVLEGNGSHVADTPKQRTIEPAIAAKALAPDANAELTANAPLTIENIAGDWAVINISIRRNGLSRSISRSTSSRFYRIGAPRSGKVQIRIVDGKSLTVAKDIEVLAEQQRRGPYLRLKSNSVSERAGISFYSLELLSYGNGVDVLREGANDSTHLIRFRPTEDAVAAGFGKLRPTEFCEGALTGIAIEADKAVRQSDLLAERFPELLSNYSSTTVARYAMFATSIFRGIFGVPFEEMSRKAHIQFLERVTYCGAIHSSPLVRGMLDTAVLTSVDYDAIRGLFKLGHTGGNKKPISLNVAGYELVEMISTAKAAQSDLEEIRTLAGAPGADIEILAERLRTLLEVLPPSEASDLVEDLGERLATLKATEEEERRRHQELTAPDVPIEELLATATQEFVVSNCNRAFLLLRSASKGLNSNAIAFARSVESVGDWCVVNMATHLLRFRVNEVVSPACSSGDPAQCRFQLYWYCTFGLNPDFGFSPSTADFDPVCPVVRQSPVSVEGIFEKSSRLRWSAISLDWS